MVVKTSMPLETSQNKITMEQIPRLAWTLSRNSSRTPKRSSTTCSNKTKKIAIVNWAYTAKVPAFKRKDVFKENWSR